MSDKDKRTRGYKATQPQRLPSVGSATVPIPDIEWDYEMRCERDNVSDFYKNTTLKTVLSLKRAEGEDTDKLVIYKGLVVAELLNPTLDAMDEYRMNARVSFEYSSKGKEIRQRLAKEQGLDSVVSITEETVKAIIIEKLIENGIKVAHRRVTSGTGPFPPVVISRKGEKEFIIEDGNHRIYVWKERGFTIIPALIIDYTRENPHYNKNKESRSRSANIILPSSTI